MKVETKYGQALLLGYCPALSSREGLDFLTEVHESYDGSEQRYQLRDFPRQTLAYTFDASDKAFGDIFHAIYSNLRGLFALTMPLHAVSIPDTNGDFIEIDTANLMGLKSGYALISSEFVEIVGVGRYVLDENEEPQYIDGIRLNKGINVVNAKITPIKICIIDGDANINTGGYYSSTTAKFRVLADDLTEYTATEPQQYKGDDIYYMPIWTDAGKLESTLTQHQNIIDGSIGGFQSYTHHKKPRYLKPFKIKFKSKLEYIAAKDFLYRRNGRLKPFWLPLYENHINVLNTGYITNRIQTDTNLFLESDKKHIAIKRKNGNWSAHEITSKTINSMTISPPINANLAEIAVLCYLGLHRLDSDLMEFEFLGNDVGMTTIPIVEINE